ncbi:MAG: ferrochelatase [Alphaproteobacteria bacterium]|nr:ferrochelatase [Alphaproteobacteria bacterium]
MNPRNSTQRIGIVLFNLGGPDRPEAVLPFLRNLFRDPAILRVPGLVRVLLAEAIARRRAPVAREIYSRIGGRSPIVPETEAQARALEAAVQHIVPNSEVKAFVVMRYWHPRAGDVAAAVQAFKPDRVVLLPLYPQFSTTTTESSLAEWQRMAVTAKTVALVARTSIIGCYGAEAWFVKAYADVIRPVLEQARAKGNPRVLFSAHGLPQRIADAGDPYLLHTQQTAAAVAAEIGLVAANWRLCYQSRVGRLAWIGPSTEEEVHRAGADRVPVVVTPISFVSEHSETLVELDIELREAALRAGVPAYFRAPAVGTNAAFIDGLATLVQRSLSGALGACPLHAGRRCPRGLCVATNTRGFKVPARA